MTSVASKEDEKSVSYTFAEARPLQEPPLQAIDFRPDLPYTGFGINKCVRKEYTVSAMAY